MLVTTAPLVIGVGKPITDALKQNNDLLFKAEQAALQKAANYKSQLDEANTYVLRLEKSYEVLVHHNSCLRAKVASDASLLQELRIRLEEHSDVQVTQEKRLIQLSGELHLAETHREQLNKARVEAEIVSKKLSKNLSQATAEVENLRTDLAEALQNCTNFEAQLKASNKEMATQKASAERNESLLSSALEEAKVELSAAKSSFAEQEETHRHQLSAAISDATDLSSQLEKKGSLLHKLEDELLSVVAQKDALSKELEESSTLVATLQSSLEEATKDAATAAAKVDELEAQLATENQRYEQLSQQSDADHAAAALAMEEAEKKFSADIADALQNAKSASEEELGAERERMSMEIARMQAEYTSKLDSLTADLAAATKQSAADEKEKARLENLLDERNLLISQLEQKCSERAVEITNLQQNLTVAAHEALSTAEKAAKLQQELEETTEELEEKRVALESISAFAGKQNNISSAAPTAPTSAIKKRRAASSPSPAYKNPRMKHKACLNENPISRTLILEDEEEPQQQPYESEPQDAWDFNTDSNPDDEEEEEEDVDEEALRTALVIHTTGRPTSQAAGRPMRQARMRQSQVLVEEVDDSDEESYEQVPPPRALHRNKAPAVKPAKPCIKPTAGASRAAPKSRLAAMRPANSFKPSQNARRGNSGAAGKAAKGVSENRGGGFGSQNHSLFNLFGGLGNASPGDS